MSKQWRLSVTFPLINSVFEPCHTVVPVDSYFLACVKDVCDNSCASLEAYATECAGAGVCLDWRDQTDGLCGQIHFLISHYELAFWQGCWAHFCSWPTFNSHKVIQGNKPNTFHNEIKYFRLTFSFFLLHWRSFERAESSSPLFVNLKNLDNFLHFNQLLFFIYAVFLVLHSRLNIHY